MNGKIYKITNTTNNKIYIGQTIKILQKRLRQHFYSAKNNKSKTYLQSAILKYGQSAFTIELVEENIESHDELNNREYFWIEQLKSYDNSLGYNIKRSIDNKGIMSGITKEKISKKNTGKKRTSEQKSNISKSKMGKRQSATHIEARMKSKRGEKQSPEHIQKRINKIKGKKLSQESIDKRTATRKLTYPKPSVESIQKMLETRLKKGLIKKIKKVD